MSNVISALILTVSIILGAMAHARVTHYFSPFETCVRIQTQAFREQIDGRLTNIGFVPMPGFFERVTEEEREIVIKIRTNRVCSERVIK